MSILDHNDHVKAGRAVIIVSVMYIFLNQCVVEFSQIRLLGLDVRISSSELLSLVRWLLYAYAALFFVRLFQSGIFSRYVLIDSKSKESLDAQLDLLLAYWSQKDTDISRSMESHLNDLPRDHPDHSKMFESVKARARRKRARFDRTHSRQMERARLYAVVKKYVDFGFPILVEAVIPLAFLIVAFFVRVDWFVCSAQAAQDATSLLDDLRARV